MGRLLWADERLAGSADWQISKTIYSVRMIFLVPFESHSLGSQVRNPNFASVTQVDCPSQLPNLVTQLNYTSRLPKSAVQIKSQLPKLKVAGKQ